MPLRASHLPPLSQCGQFLREIPPAFPLQRSERMDVAFRGAMAGMDAGSLTSTLTPADKSAVRWAADTVRLMSRSYTVLCGAEPLPVEIPGIPGGGTVDGLCEDGGWHAHVIPGPLVETRATLAACALGFMHRFDREEWTAYELFCDLRVAVTRHFTRQSAQDAVDRALVPSRHGSPPRVNPFCGDCSRRWSCPARCEELGTATPVGLALPDFESLPSEKLARFAGWALVVAEWQVKARELLKARKLTGEKIPGVRLIPKRGPRRLPAAPLVRALDRLGPEAVLTACGPLSEPKARALWAMCPDLDFPEDELVELPGTASLTVSRVIG